jgi:hypothetical protein
MHPWMLQQVAAEHRRDLLDQAGRWRLLHRQAPSSSNGVQLTSRRSRFRFNRPSKQVPSMAPAVPVPPTASATYAC